MLDPVHERLQLLSPLRTYKRMKLVDDEESRSFKYSFDGCSPVAQHRFEGLRRDE